jgi:hypothetical protein
VLRSNPTLLAQQVPGDSEARYRSEEAVGIRHGTSIEKKASDETPAATITSIGLFQAKTSDQ